MKKGIIEFCLLLLVLGGTECAAGTKSKANVLLTQTVYRGTIYTPFSLLLPSDYADPSSTRNNARSKGNVRKASVTFDESGWTESADAGKSAKKVSDTPVGSPWILVVLGFLYVLFRRRRLALVVSCMAVLPATATTVSVQLQSAAIRTGETVIVTPTLTDPPVSKAFVCWDLYYDQACTQLVPGVRFRGTPTLSSANSVSFRAPEPGTYFLKTLVRISLNACAETVDCETVSTVHVYPSVDAVFARGQQRAGRLVPLSNQNVDCTVYGVMDFNKDTINNPAFSPYSRYNYFISFPFDVRVGDIYGFGNYGQHWLIEYYDGLSRAQNGYWADSQPNWKRIDDTDSVLHAYQGYLLKLNSIRMAADQTDVWANEADVVTLYFPALTSYDLTLENETIPALSEAYRCTIDLSSSLGDEGDRTIKDSFWRCIGAPGTTGYNTSDISFLYEWDLTENSLSVVEGAGYSFAPMHAYLIQQQEPIIWRSSAPAMIAPRTALTGTELSLRLDLQQGGNTLDHTFIRLTDDGNASADFVFGQDLSKEMNSGANIYSLIGYERAAGNSLPYSTPTTSVPLGVQLPADGDYSFSLSAPDSHSAALQEKHITLVDQTTQTRTLLTSADYTVFLPAGSTDTRFVLEIAPADQTPTALDHFPSSSSATSQPQKHLINGVLYILRDGKWYDMIGKVRE